MALSIDSFLGLARVGWKMRFVFVPLLVVLAAFACSRTAHVIETAEDLSNLCHRLDQGTKGNGAHIRIPKTSAVLQCWGYMQAMQDLSVLVDENGNRFIGSCPPEQITVLQLIGSHRFDRLA